MSGLHTIIRGKSSKMWIIILCIFHCSQIALSYTTYAVSSGPFIASRTFSIQRYNEATSLEQIIARNTKRGRAYTSIHAETLDSSETLQDECEEPNPGDRCSLDQHKTITKNEGFYLDSQPVKTTYKPLINPIFILPLIAPFIAYMTYDDVARLFDVFINVLAYERKWVPADGGAYQAKIIAPAINGIVVPTISILFATLTSNTISSLRQRQIDIHTCLNSEAGDLRVLSMLVDAYPMNSQKVRCREYLDQYTSRLIAESADSKTSKVMYGSTDSEMNGFVAALNQLANGRSKSSPPDVVLSQSYGAVVRLNTIRSSRITALQSTFPVLHYAILELLAASICIAFLVETDQEVLIFLNLIQLRILWTMLIGSITALTVVCWDLSFPFTGSYIISNAVDQLMTIRDTVRAASEDEETG